MAVARNKWNLKKPYGESDFLNIKLEALTLKQLRALHAVVQHRSIAAAAQHLGLTPPAVHNQLKLLEDIVGSPLLHKEGKERTRLTKKGSVVLGVTEEIDAALQRLIGRMQAIEMGHSGRTILGVVSTAKYFAPRIVARLQKEKPEIEVVLKVGNRSEVITALERREYDLCIMGRPPRQSALDAEPLADHPHVIIAAPDHPLAGRNGLSRDDIMHERFIMRERGSGTRILAARFLSDVNYVRDTMLLELESNETIKQAVMSGLGIALLSAHTIRDEIELGRLAVLDVAGTPIYRKWYLLSPGLKYDSQGCNAVVHDWILENLPKFLTSKSAI